MNPLYRLDDTEFFPTLSPRQIIPNALKSAPGQGKVGMGMVKAICSILCRLEGFAMQGARWQATLRSYSDPQTTVYEIGGDSGTWYVPGVATYRLGVVGALDMMVNPIQNPSAQQFNLFWEEYLRLLRSVIGAPPPYTKDQVITSASGDQRVVGGMMKVTDALYVAMQAREQLGGLSVLDQACPHQLSVNTTELRNFVFRGSGVGVGALVLAGDAAKLQVLRRAIRKGGRPVLLVGPTGVGKTEAAVQAATEEGVGLEVLKGHPNMDDKQVYGGIWPDDEQVGAHTYIIGPLTRALRHIALALRDGRSGSDAKVVVVLDELARWDPYYAAVLIGAMDRYTGAAVHAQSKTLPWKPVLPPTMEDHWYYYMVTVGKHTYVVPVESLAFVATTNLGDDYQQLSSRLDGALLGRFARILEFDRLPTRQQILEEQGLPAAVAAMLVEVEDLTCGYTTASAGTAQPPTPGMLGQGMLQGTLQRPLNLRTLKHWGDSAQELVEEGIGWQEAIRVAAECTAIPFVVPRKSNGQLEDAPAEWLRNQIVAKSVNL